MCPCHAAKSGSDVIWQPITSSSSCLIHTSERSCLSKKYDVYWTFTRMPVVKAKNFIHILLSFVFHSGFLCQLHARTCPLYNVLLDVVCCCFQEMTHFYKHDVRWVIELHLSTKFHVCLQLVSYASRPRTRRILKLPHLTPFLGM